MRRIARPARLADAQSVRLFALRHVLAALVLATALGCAGGLPPDATAVRIATPLAYEIESPGGARALLFGSVHVARENEWQLPDDLHRALAEADLLVLEIDPQATSPEEMRELRLGLGAMPPQQRLRQVVSEETWALLEARAPETGIPLAQLDRLKPWVVALRFAGLSLQQAGLEMQHGVERGLIEAAPQLPVRGLETPFQQLAAFDGLPYPVQDRLLLEALRPSEGGDGTGDPLLEAWRRGDARRLEEIVFKDRNDPQLSRFYEETYERRNVRMTEALVEILEDTQRAFVVIGAGHLVGRRSIPTLLRSSGFVVRQVSGQPR